MSNDMDSRASCRCIIITSWRCPNIVNTTQWLLGVGLSVVFASLELTQLNQLTHLKFVLLNDLAIDWEFCPYYGLKIRKNSRILYFFWMLVKSGRLCDDYSRRWRWFKSWNVRGMSFDVQCKIYLDFRMTFKRD